jgi:hypothetical protein
MDPANSEPRGRGRPLKKPRSLKNSEARRRAVYARLKVKPDNARAQSSTSARAARIKIGARKRAFVEKTAQRMLATGVKPRGRKIAEQSGCTGNPAMSYRTAQRYLKQLGY